MRKFIEEGEILFRPLSFYRYLEGPKSDPYDGLLFYENVNVSMKEPGNSNWTEIEGIRNAKFSSNLASTNFFISCFSQKRVNENGLEKHGSTTIEILDVPNFLRVVDCHLRTFSLKLYWGSVEYIGEEMPSSFKGNFGNLWLYKRNLPQFAEEAEFRIGFDASEANPNQPLSDNLLVSLGPLTEIAKIL